MKIIGLTGSIAMGKSTAAGLFRELGFPVFDADQAVHTLYAEGGAAVSEIARAFPQAVIDGVVDRKILSRIVTCDPDAIHRLETIVHPLVRQLEREFVLQSRKSGEKLIVLDLPLLFETGRDHEMDAVIVVSTTADIQKRRALERPDMSAEKLDTILANQMPDMEKRRRADFVIDTGVSVDHARDQLRSVIEKLLSNSTTIEL